MRVGNEIPIPLKDKWCLTPFILLDLLIALSIAVSFVMPVNTDAAQEKIVRKQSFQTERTRYDFCGAHSWQRRGGFCGDGQTGKGYTVCEDYLKELNQSLPKLTVCDIPVPSNFKRPDWEEMDIKVNLQLAYEAELLIFSDFTWYKRPDFETWKKQMLEDIAAGKIVPRMRKALLTPTSKGKITILGYTRDSAGCDKGMKGVLPKKDSMNHWWTNSGYVHFVQTTWGGLSKIHGVFGTVSQRQHELLVYEGEPYFVDAPGAGAAFDTSTINPRSRSIIALDNFLTRSNASPDYLYTKQFCQFMTGINLIHLEGNKP
jgi:hypothetical protein